MPEMKKLLGKEDALVSKAQDIIQKITLEEIGKGDFISDKQAVINRIMTRIKEEYSIYPIAAMRLYQKYLNEEL